MVGGNLANVKGNQKTQKKKEEGFSKRGTSRQVKAVQGLQKKKQNVATRGKGAHGKIPKKKRRGPKERGRPLNIEELVKRGRIGSGQRGDCREGQENALAR